MTSAFDLHLDILTTNYINAHYDVAKMDINEYCKILNDIRNQIAEYHS